MTYVPTVQGWLYLAGVTDVFSRVILGWSMAHHRKTDLVVDAVTMAVHRRGGKVPDVIHHSDRGGEYTSHLVVTGEAAAGLLVEQLALQRREHALGERVIEAVRDAAHAGQGAVAA